ncbi:unnamed protein product [Lampetra planeri]
MRTRGLAVGRSWMLPLLLLLLLLPLLMCVAARGGWVAERVKELRAGVQLLDGYLDSAMEYLGGEDGVCRYTCANGAEPEPRRDYTPAAPNGCGSPVFGIQFDVGVPAMTRCCNDHDRCYDVCGAEKRACDTAFRRCLSRICSLVGVSFTISPETLDVPHPCSIRGIFVLTTIMDPQLEYNMNHASRGLALIFNHENFHWTLRLNQRRGTQADSNNLERRLRNLGFTVRVHKDICTTEFHQVILQAAKADHSGFDCFVCAVFTHGEPGILYTKDGLVKTNDILEQFRGTECPSLVGKPKIFIFQACRGDKHDEPVLVETDAVDHFLVPEENVVVADAGIAPTLPSAADFLLCYSVAEGYYSHRETVNGSWYIQDLVTALERHGSELELLELLTLVNRMVAARCVDRSNDIKSLGKKQVPCFLSMLTRKLYFRVKQPTNQIA